MFSLRMESPSTCCRMIETAKIHDSQPNTVKKISHSHLCTSSIHITANAHSHLWYRIQPTLPYTLRWLTVMCFTAIVVVCSFVCMCAFTHSRHAFVCVWWWRWRRRWRWRLSVACNAIADVTHIHAYTRTHRQRERADLSLFACHGLWYCVVQPCFIASFYFICYFIRYFVFFVWICLRYGRIRTSHV